ncbi:MAG: stage II sporulation protein M [Bacteroidia bacterium]|jgi:uncharacterized membrane protein SpoIIM required for sporulation
MRESRFIEENADKWQKLENSLKENTLPAAELERAYTELNEDLAYARTFYKNRAIRRFLNNLLSPIYLMLHKSKRPEWKSIPTFFTETAPGIFYQARMYMLVSFITVIIGFAIGYFATRQNAEFANTILGDNYVRMTEQNIAKGDPLGVYKQSSPGSMFAYIAGNNLKVAAFFLVFGSLFCLGTVYLLLMNGMMLGAFTWMFTSRGLGTEYLLTVYQHGTLEMLGMVVEGAAGIMLGAGILFPGSLTRIRSLQHAAKKSVRLFLICVPIILLAAFIESYLTRFTELPTALRSAIIFLSFFFMLFYFIIYPWIKFRKSNAILGNYDNLNPDETAQLKAGVLYSIGDAILFGFSFVRQKSSFLLIAALLSLCVLYPLASWIHNDVIAREVGEKSRAAAALFNGYGLNNASMIQNGVSAIFFIIYASSYYFSPLTGIAVVINSWLPIAAAIYMVLRALKPLMESYNPVRHTTLILAAIIGATFQVLLNSIFGSGWWLALFFGLPFQVVMGVHYCTSQPANPFAAFMQSITQMLGSFWRYLGISLLLFSIYCILMCGMLYLGFIILSAVNQLHGASIISENIMMLFVYLNYAIFPALLLFFAFPIAVTALSLIEAKRATILQNKIASIQLKKEYYGVESES